MKKNNDFAIALMRENYGAYCYFVHNGKWIDTKFHKYLTNTIQNFIETKTDNPFDILVISTPPQHGKSLTVTETFPSWYIGKYPDKRCIIGCYGDDFAGKFGRRNKQKIEQYGRFIFNIATDKSSDREILIKGENGSIITRGIMSGITGNSGDLIILDDPIKNRLEADSFTYRERLWEEWQNSIKTRTQAGTKIILIQTRWHEDDLAGRIIANENNVTVVNIPCECDSADDLLGRELGDALCPEIGKDKKWLIEFKKSYKEGARAWNALFQGRPTSQEGNLFKREWWKYYDNLPNEIPIKIISVDATFKGNDDNDYVAIEVWGKVNADFYLIDLIKKRMDFPETIRAIKVINEKHSDRHSILIEDKANGSAIISVLQHEISGLIPIMPKDSKISRANAITGIIESGNVYLPRYAEFTDEFVEECASFPNGTNDDCVDSMTQALNRFIYWDAEVKKDYKSDFEKQIESYKKSRFKKAKTKRSY